MVEGMDTGRVIPLGDSLTARVVETLRARIISSDLEPGARLNQAALAAELGVSRIPVRDALRTLASEGLVELRGRSGAIVTQLSVHTLQELYELREAIEPLVSRLGVLRIGRAQIQRMRELLEVMLGGPATADWLRANAAFHAEVYRGSGRPLMIALVEQLRRQTDRYLRLHVEVIGQTEHLDAEHERILEAAARRDAEAVQQLTAAHLATSHEFILQYLLREERTGAASGDAGADA
jgi:DNA-binding GntR family transcriptional regulator